MSFGDLNGWKRVDPPVRAVCGKREYRILAVQERCGLKARVVPMDAAEGTREIIFLVGYEVDVPDRRALDDLRALVGRARAIRPRKPLPVPTCRETSYFILRL